jgi:hypothetical protein
VLFFALLVGAHELAGLWRLRADRSAVLRRILLRGACVVAALLPAMILYRFSTLADLPGDPLWSSPFRKAVDLLSPFMTYSKPIGLLTFVAVASAAVLLWRGAARDAGTVLALLVLAAVYAIAPTMIKGVAFIEVRPPLMMALLIFAGFRPVVPQTIGRALAVAVAALLLLRVGHVTEVWYDHRRDLTELRASIAPVEAGARVLVVSAAPAASPAYLVDEPAGRRIPDLYRVDAHVAALLLIERHAFWPLLFASPSQQPVIVLPPYDAIARPLGEPPDYRRLAGQGVAAPDAPYLAGWPKTFDYVLLINAGAVGDPASVEPDRLELLNRSDMAVLYRVRHPL